VDLIVTPNVRRDLFFKKIFIAMEVRYIDSIDESDKNMLLRKERKEAKIFNVEQQKDFSYTLELVTVTLTVDTSHTRLFSSMISLLEPVVTVIL
jgi:hypothetical protein